MRWLSERLSFSAGRAALLPLTLLEQICTSEACAVCLALPCMQDGTSFLNIPYWSDSNTELYTVTILTGGCIIPQSQYSKPIADVLAAMATSPGCNARSVNNETLVPILLQDATIDTTQPLLIRLVSNVTLGANLQSPIVFARPVVIVGASSAPVSVDLQMVVNQFNVTRRNAQLSWQAVVLENLAPGRANLAWR